uniref:Uncharacterized protein n=1 Tax=Monopterus albus TaxID=43700 RepID=A0A3Q3QWN8_MONAL
ISKITGRLNHKENNQRYIDVKKGGVSGVGMLLAGYCVLSYIWSYPHIKRDRWRKYH